MNTVDKIFIIAFIVLGFILFTYLEDTIKSPKTHDVYLRGEMVAKSVQPVLDVLDSAEKGDTVRIYVSSQGGVYSVGQSLVKHIQRSKARVIYIVDEYAMSAATMPLCYMKPENIRVANDSMLLFHFVQIAIPDKGQMPLLKMDIKYDPALQTLKRSAIILFKPCMRLLTQEQQKRFKQGEDIWLLGADINKKL